MVMPRKGNMLTNVLILAPFWVSLVMAAIAYVFLSSVLPAIAFSNPVYKSIAAAGPLYAPGTAVFFVFLAIISAVRRQRIRKQFEQQESVKTLNDLSWKAFEDVTGEFFRREGYSVMENLVGGADGGVDLRLQKDGQRFLVQCKRWKSKRVGLPVVRELLGALTAESADKGIMVATSSFTGDAISFARKHDIKLIDGAALGAAINRHAETPPSLPETAPSLPEEDSTPLCPKCGASMVRRSAKKGSRAGESFWGCSMFPCCRGTRGLG